MTAPVQELPPLALSVRQPWAWAILHGGKVIENRSLGAIRSGGMDCRRIALHAAAGLTEKEYRWGYTKLADHGVRCPPPATLVRGAIIGAVTVVDIISQSDSPWFGKSRPGNHGLVLEDPVACAPIAAKGALGYFAWEARDDALIPSPLPWMRKYGSQAAGPEDGGKDPDGQPPSLFGDLPFGFKEKPGKPF
ncbi:MAG: hypothetical protein KI785_03785 [Devosiaceae bacterium]|nr:hypothetical protein [Devosiaceae bacterium MH13]